CSVTSVSAIAAAPMFRFTVELLATPLPLFPRRGLQARSKIADSAADDRARINRSWHRRKENAANARRSLPSNREPLTLGVKWYDCGRVTRCYLTNEVQFKIVVNRCGSGG